MLPPPQRSLERSTPTRSLWIDAAIAGAILLVGALLKLAYFDAYASGGLLDLEFPDEWVYYLPGAEMILDQGFGFFLEQRSLWNGPLNLLWIAMFGGEVLAVKLANVALSIGTGFLLWDVARRSFGRQAGLLAVVLYSLHLPFYVFTPTLLTEPLFIPLFSLFLWLVVLATDRAGRPLILGLAGAALGFATLARPTTQLLPFFLLGLVVLLALFVRLRPESDIDMAALWKQSGLLLLGFVIVVAPYVAKNAIVLDKVGIANGAGAVFYLGNDLRTNGDEPSFSQMRFNTEEITAPYSHLDTEGDSRLIRATIDEIRERPLDIAWLQPRKAFRLLFGSADHYFRPQSDVVAFVQERSGLALLNVWDLVFTTFLVVFGVIGMITVPMRLLPRLTLIGSALYFVLVHTALFPIPRLALPIFPILVVFVAGFLTRISVRWTIAGAVAALAVFLIVGFQGIWSDDTTVSDRYVSYFDEVMVSGVGEPERTNDLIVDSGVLESVGTDPYLIFDVEDFDATLNQIVFIEVEAEAPPDGPESAAGQLFWSAEGVGFSEERSVRFPIEFGGDALIYPVSPSFRGPWEGEISRLRIDLPDGVPGARYNIAAVQVRK
jgi:hypothetical protein